MVKCEVVLKKILFLVFLNLSAPALYSAIEIYPGPGGNAYTSSQYKVEVCKDGQWVDSYTYMYSRKSVCDNYFKDQYPTISWTTLGLSGEALVRVKKLTGAISTAAVLPLSYGNINWYDSNSVYLYVKPNQKIGVKINNDLFHTMHIFANPLKPAVPSGALYFGPGVHDIGFDYALSPSQNAVYLDGGAWVKGTLNIINAKNVKIVGPGILSGENWKWEEVSTHPFKTQIRYTLIHAVDSGPDTTLNTPVQISGITMVASPMYNFFLPNQSSLSIDNVQIISRWTHNTDSFGVFGNPATISNSFCLTNDNAIFPEFIKHGNYTVTDCVISARAVCNVGYGYFKNLTTWGKLKNIDVIYPEFVSLLFGNPTYHSAIFDAIIDGPNSTMVVKNQVHENIVMSDTIDQLVAFKIEDTDWGAAGPAQGNIQNIHFKNVEVLGTQRFKSVMRGKDSSNRIDNITFTNVKMNGEYLDAYNYSNYFVIGPYASNIFFKVTDTNLLDNGNFERSYWHWNLWNDTATRASSSYQPESNTPLAGKISGKYVISNGGTGVGHIAVFQGNLPFEAGKEYEISFTAKADANKPIAIAVQQNYAPWTTYASFNMTISTASQSYGPYRFTCPVNDPNLRFSFFLGGNTADIWLDTVSLKPVNTIRNYQADSDARFWALWTTGASAVLTTDTNSVLSGVKSHKVTITSCGTEKWNVGL
ncbi:MAG TPA: carbohydrate binding domain-containing protein, partial [Methylococcales bacterium]